MFLMINGLVYRFMGLTQAILTRLHGARLNWGLFMTFLSRATRPISHYVGWLVDMSHILSSERMAITAPAQPPATGLPCIRPCFSKMFHWLICMVDLTNSVAGLICMISPHISSDDTRSHSVMSIINFVR